MKHNNLIRFAFGLVLLPVTGLNTSMVTPKVESPQSILVQKMNNGVESLLALNQATDDKTKTLQLQADAIDAYFTKRSAPLAGLGMKMAVEADKNGLDWRLLPAIATRESNAGKMACKRVAHSFFGWGSCHIAFDSDEQAIEIVAAHLGGNMDSTDQYYEGKTTYQILRKYNTVIKKYPEEVINIMNMIGPEDVSTSDITPNKTV
ncbi:MAG: hypothetical protein NTW62_03505 [Candidatus Nomurabacteria bacterium]|nr:hypothetical protein [Candidatus Nomurabacteria bacterium]